ncbi:hypothetical protein [Streptomyces sp. NPDC050416]|uniref:hypothetical protein n=1 Tax=Streptomyces sp. NPDC050416 TaxID=3365611 RepID=UPI00379B01F9
MENQQKPPEGRFRTRRMLLASVAGCAVLGGVLVLLPSGRQAEPAPPSPGAVAMAAVTAGVPAALPGLAELIDEREKRLRACPRDARSWAVLGAAYLTSSCQPGRGAPAGSAPSLRTRCLPWGLRSLDTAGFSTTVQRGGPQPVTGDVPAAGLRPPGTGRSGQPRRPATGVGAGR